MLLATDDQGDPHRLVVHHRAEVVERDPVRPEHHEVVQVAGLLRDLPDDLVLEAEGLVPVGRPEAHHRGAARHRRGPVAAGPLVLVGTLLALEDLAAFVQLLLGAVAEVRLLLGDQPVRRRPVARQPLGLEVRRVRPANAGPLVPLEPQPAEPVEDGLDRLGGGPLPIRVLDPEDEPAMVAAGLQPVEEGGTRTADVEVAGGRGGKPDTGGYDHDGTGGINSALPGGQRGWRRRCATRGWT